MPICQRNVWILKVKVGKPLKYLFVRQFLESNYFRGAK